MSSTNPQIIDAVTRRIRIITAEQAGSAWWAHSRNPEKSAARRLDAFCRAGLLRSLNVYAYPLPPLDEPVHSWTPSHGSQPADPSPEYGEIAWRLKSRWARCTPKVTTAYTATPTLANRVGGYNGRYTQPNQVTHDLAMTFLFLRVLREEPALARAWRGEELQKPSQGYGEKLPDATCYDEAGEPFLVYEFGGRYSKARVRDFHEHCEGRGLAYLLW